MRYDRFEGVDGPVMKFVFSVVMLFLFVLFLISAMRKCEDANSYSGKVEPIPPVEDSVYIAGTELKRIP